MENLSSKTIKGYELLERIGAGGFGAVYKAHQSTVGREVAVKIILPGFANQPEFIRRFETEAQLIARLEHPYIVPLYDFWRDPDGAYLVMRWLRGGTLRDALQPGPFDLESTALMLDHICSALDLAHRNNVIHRDLKPGNVLLDEDGNAYLADFGIAKDLAGFKEDMTQADAIVGSLDYLSPEQARSEPVTPRTDIYSLGVMLYEALIGQHPFHNVTSVERLYKHINDPLPDLQGLDPDVQEAISEVIQKATEKNPEHRFQDALALAAAFRQSAGLGQQSPSSIVEQLTRREQEILLLLSQGRSNKEIANELVVAVSTVKWYVTQIFRKLGVRSRVQATIRARELNLIVSDPTNGAETLSPVSVSYLPEPENPYKGLHAFQAADNRDFFGREEITKTLLKRLDLDDEGSRLLAVVGPSGSGKSSLVKAGLIPALWRGELAGSESWFVAEMLPGTRPLDKLEIALTRVAANQSSNLHEQLQRDHWGLVRVADLILPDDGSELVLVIDQFEEVFTLLEDEAARQHFLGLIYAAVTDPSSRVRVVLTLRADFYDRPLHYPEFGELVRNHMETVLPLSAKELERTIAGPVARVGVTFEEGLAAHIVSEMTYQAGALPLLQYALTELFENREGRELTHAAYTAIGGAVGALANRSEEVYRELDEEAQETARQMFMRLVTLGEGAEDTRRRAARSELLAIASDPDVMDEIIDTYATYRLLSLDNDPETRTPTVEVAHEAILREWERLRQWLNESRDDIRQERAVSHAAEEWDTHNRDASYLLRGARLEQVEKWQGVSNLVLTPIEQEFIANSLQQREQDHKTEVARKERETHLEQRSRNVLRTLVGVFAIAAMIAIGLSIIAFNERGRAEAALIISDENYQLSEARRLAGASTLLLPNVTQDAELAVLLALYSLKTEYSAEADAALTQASSLLYTEKIIPPVNDVLFETAALSPDETLIATGDTNGFVRLWNAPFSRPTLSLPRQNGIIEEALFSPDSTELLTLVSDISGDAGYVRLWDVTSGDLIREQFLEKGFPDHADFTPDGERLTIATYSYLRDPLSIYVWDASTWETLMMFDDAANIIVDQNVGGADALSLSALNTQIAYINVDGHIVLRSWETGEVEAVLENIATDISSNALIFSSDGSQLAVAYHAGIFVIDVATQSVKTTLINPPGESVARLAFTPDGKRILLTATSNLYLFDVETGDELRRFSGGTRHINPLFFQDGKRFIAISDDGLRFWNADLDYLSTSIAVEGFFPKSSTDGSILASANEQIVIYDAATGETLKTLPNDTGAFWTALSPDNRYLFVGTPDNPAVLTMWEWQTETLVWQKEIPFGIGESDFSPDGRYIISPHNDGVARLWNSADGSLVREFGGESLMDFFASFSPDGSKIVAGGTGLTAQIWDVETGDLLQTYQVADNPDGWLMSAEFSPDSHFLTTVSRDDGVQVWDVASGERLFDATTYGARGRFSHKSRYLAYTAENNHIVLLDVETMQVARRIFSNHPSGRRIWFSPDDRYVFMGNTDQTYSQYEVELSNVITDACSRLTRDFTPQEQDRYYMLDDEPTCPKFASVP